MYLPFRLTSRVRKNCFKGLAIEQMEKEWTGYPVIHLDLSCGKYYSLENTKIILNNILKVEEQKYGIEVPESEREGFGARFRDILLVATAQTGKQVVGSRSMSNATPRCMIL